MVVNKIEHLPNQEVKLQISVPSNEVEKTREKVISDLASEIKIDGFRKGKAPKEVVEEKLDAEKIRAEIINRLVSNYYIEAVKEQNITPLMPPKVEIKKFEEGLDLEFEAHTALRPEVKLKDHKKAVNEALEKKDKKIYGPNGEPTEQKQKKEANRPDKVQSAREKQQAKAIQALLEEIEVNISELLIERETNNMLSRLLGQLEQMDIPVEQYLESQGITAEELRKRYSNLAEQNLKLEFALDEIAKDENIQVSDEEIKDAIKHAPEEEIKKTLKSEQGKAYIRHVLKNRKVMEGLVR